MYIAIGLKYTEDVGCIGPILDIYTLIQSQYFPTRPSGVDLPNSQNGCKILAVTQGSTGVYKMFHQFKLKEKFLKHNPSRFHHSVPKKKWCSLRGT